MTPDLLLDRVLAVSLLVVAWAALHSAQLFRGVVFFIVHGLVISLCWARLGAPDIALAEAAIGAGVTGALLLDAARQMGAAPSQAVGRGLRLAGVVVAVCVTAVLVSAVLSLPRATGGLTAEVAAALEASGVAHPVTAVLLNFRGYDTWLELGVLLLAALGVLALRRSWALPAGTMPAAEPMLEGALRLLLPLALLVAVHLLARGVSAPGGAFQAGAVGGAVGVLVFLSGRRALASLAGVRLRMALMAGLLAFWAAAAGAVMAGGRMLELPEERAYAVLLVVETLVAVSIAITLAALFPGARPLPDGEGAG